MTSGCGGRKFFLPRIIKDPVGRYSPEGAVFDTWGRCRGAMAVRIRVSMMVLVVRMGWKEGWRRVHG